LEWLTWQYADDDNLKKSICYAFKHYQTSEFRTLSLIHNLLSSQPTLGPFSTRLFVAGLPCKNKPESQTNFYRQVMLLAGSKNS